MLHGMAIQEIVNLLIEQHADVNHKDNAGRTALIVAAIGDRNCKSVPFKWWRKG